MTMLKHLWQVDQKDKLAIAYVWAATLLGAVLAFATQVILARTLGVQSFGVLTATLGLIGFVAPLAGFGVSGFWLKCFGEEGWSAIRWLKPSFKFAIYSTILVIIAIYFWGLLGPNDLQSRWLIFILAWTVLGSQSIELVSAKLQLEGRFAIHSIVQSLQPTLKFLILLILVSLVSTEYLLESVGWVLFFVSIVSFLLLVPQIRKILSGDIVLEGHGIRPIDKIISQNQVSIMDVYSETWVFGVAGVLYLAWGQGHIVLAKYCLGNTDAGVYGSAMVLLNAICLIPSISYSKFMLPKIHRWANHDLKMLKKVYVAGNKLMFSVGVIAMLSVWLFSPWGVELVFGESYKKAAGVLMILALTLPIRFLGYSVGSLLVTKHHMRLKVKVMIIVVGINITLALLLMPIWGLAGLAFTIVMSEMILIFFYHILIKKEFVTDSLSY